MANDSRPSAEELSVLARVVADVARRRRLSPDEAEDFSQTVHVLLLERGYDVFRRFSGRGSLRSYLKVVVDRWLLDWLRAARGTWRPSAAARSLGPHAVLLDRLIHRDEHPRDEAVGILLSRGGVPAEADLRRLADGLPPHTSRRTLALESLDRFHGRSFEDPIERREQERVERVVRRALRRALRELPSEDSRLIDLRYGQRQRVPAIARALQTDAKALYRQYERVLRSLRLSLEAKRVTGPCALAAPVERPPAPRSPSRGRRAPERTSDARFSRRDAGRKSRYAEVRLDAAVAQA